MKTMFYKKILPLALVASLTVSGFAGAYSASAANTAAPAAVVSQVDTPDVGLTSGDVVSYTTPAEIKFDYFDVDTVKENFSLTFVASPGSSADFKSLIKTRAYKTQLKIRQYTALGADISGLEITGMTAGNDITDTTDPTIVVGTEFTISGTIKADVNTMQLSGLVITDKDGLSLSGTTKFDLTVSRDAKANKTEIKNGVFSFKDTKTAQTEFDLRTITGKTITEIASNGFAKVTNIQHIIIPASVTKIGSNAFNGLTKLAVIEFEGTGDITIPDDAFTGCKEVLIIGGDNVKFNTANKADVAKTAIKVKKLATSGSNANELLMNYGTELLIDVINMNVHNFKTGEIVGRLETTAEWNTLSAADKKNVKWAVYQITDEENKKTSTVGRFKNGAGFTAANVKGDFSKVGFGGLRANAAYNNSGEIRATIDVKDPTTKKITAVTLAKFKVYVLPEFVSTITEPTDTDLAAKKNNNTGSYILSKATGYSDSNKEYDLQIWEGQTYTLPFKAKDGQNKKFDYTLFNGGSSIDNCGFTVNAANGAVKALPGGANKTGIIEVRPQDGGANRRDLSAEPDIKVNVKVMPAVKALRSNITALSMVPPTSDGEKNAQSFTLSANPTSNAATEVTFSVPSGFKLEDNSGTAIANGDKRTFTGAGEFRVYLDSEAVKNLASGKILTAGRIGCTYKNSLGRDVTLNINVSQVRTNVYDNVKSIKAPGRLDKATNTITLNVPKGTVYNLGVSVLPATADTNFEWTTAKKNNAPITVENYITGDVFFAKDEGTYELQAKTNGLTEASAKLETPTYIINVYNQGGGFKWKDRNYVLRGGFLVANDNDTNQTVTVPATGGITISEPEFTGALKDDVTWTSSNTSCLAVYKGTSGSEAGKLVIKPLVAGTYTVTGTSAISKQKYTFKVKADKNLSSAKKSENAKLMYIDGTGKAKDVTGNKLKLNAGDSVKVFLDTSVDGVRGGKITFESGDNAKVGATAAGVITAKGATGESGVTVNVKMETGNRADTTTVPAMLTVVVDPAPVTNIQIKAPTYGAAGTKVAGISATATNPSRLTVKWFAKKDSAAAEEITFNNWTPSAEGTYTVYPVYYNGSTAVTNADGAVSKTIVVYKTPTHLIKALDPTGYKLTDLKGTANGQGIGIKNATNTAVTLDIPIAITATDGKLLEGKDLTDGVVWTSNNVNIATAEDKAIAATETYNRMVTVTLSTKNVGKVTLKGTTKNGGKVVSIILNVVDKNTTMNAFKPQISDIVSITGAPSVTWANTDKDNAIASKTFTFNGKIKAGAAEKSNPAYNMAYTTLDTEGFVLADDKGVQIKGLDLTELKWKNGIYANTSLDRDFTATVTVTKETALSGKNMKLTLAKYDTGAGNLVTTNAINYSVNKPAGELIMKAGKVTFATDAKIALDFRSKNEVSITLKGTYANSKDDDIGSKTSIAKDKFKFELDGKALDTNVTALTWAPGTYSGGDRAFTMTVKIKRNANSEAAEATDSKDVTVKWNDYAVSTGNVPYTCVLPDE